MSGMSVANDEWKRPGAIPRRRFNHRLQLRETFLELIADHLVHVDEQADGPAQEVVRAREAPFHDGAIALGLEGELRDGAAGKGLHEIELDPDQVVRTALGDCRASVARLTVARPRRAAGC